MKEMCFLLGNHWIERSIYCLDGVPYKSVIKNKLSGMEWQSDGREPLIALPGIELKGSNISFQDNVLLIKGADFTVRWEFTIWEDIPVIESRVGLKGACRKREAADNADAGIEGVEYREHNAGYKDYTDGFGCMSNHLTLKAYAFHDRTDYTNFLLEEKRIPLYNRRGICDCDGHVFVLSEDLTKEECLIVKNAPCEEAHYRKSCSDFHAEPISNIHICGSGIDVSEIMQEEYTYSYPVAVGVCGKEQSIPLFREYYLKDYQKQTPYIMSNTWGDRNCDKCVCEAFILKEIERAAQLGVDIVQIDDGWQDGITANSALASGGIWMGGYRKANPQFWSINKSKFPEGFCNIVKAAASKNIAIGLWFSPDNYNDYEAWEQDADVMLDFYRQYGIRYFKLDAIMVENRVCETNIIKMLTKVREESEGNVVFNMDITAGKRFGYLLHRQFGDLFVENRYTDFGNYYPHNTLRNLWELSHFIPAQRLQMEVLNNQRNKELYSDILAPSEYDIDYLFAAVMLAKPLIWMEMSELDEQSCKKLAKIISVYREYREDFEEVIPILERPNGFSLTGFKIRGKKQDYVLLIRELAENGGFDINVKEILATNDEDAIGMPVTLTRKKTYLFGIVDRKMKGIKERKRL